MSEQKELAKLSKLGLDIQPKDMKNLTAKFKEGCPTPIEYIQDEIRPLVNKARILSGFKPINPDDLPPSVTCSGTWETKEVVQSILASIETEGHSSK